MEPTYRLVNTYHALGKSPIGGRAHRRSWYMSGDSFQRVILAASPPKEPKHRDAFRAMMTWKTTPTCTVKLWMAQAIKWSDDVRP